MITIISGTNRPDSRTEIVSQMLYDLIGKYTDDEVNLIKLSEISPDFIHPKMYDPNFQSPKLTKIQDEQLIPAKKWIIVSPEYNGSFSGMVKVFIDALSIREKNDTFSNKKLGLVGVASGRAGNLRGMDHLTTSLHYMGMHVFPNRLPISQIHTLIDEENNLNQMTIDLLDSFINGFIKF